MASSFLTKEDKIPEVTRNPWVDNVFRPAVLTVMVACLSLSVTNFLKIANPLWHGSYFLIGTTLVTLEAIYAWRTLKKRRSVHANPLRYRLVEWGMLLIVLKFLSYSGKPWAFVTTDLQAIGRNPIHFLSSIEMSIFLALCAAVWLAVTRTMQDFEDLYDPFTFRTTEILPLYNLRLRFFFGGVMIVALSGMALWASRAGFAILIDLKRATAGGILLNVIVYFVLGLILLSQARLNLLLTRWEIQQVSVSDHLVKRWTRYGLVVLILVTMAIFFLPTNYSLGFFDSAATALDFFMKIVLYIAQIVIFLLLLPFALLATLLGGEEVQMPTTPPPPEGLPAASDPVTGGMPWLEVLRSLVFWLIALATVIYLIRTYLKDNPAILRWLKSRPWLRFSFGWLTDFWRWLRGAAQTAIDLLPKRVETPDAANPTTSTSKWRWPRLGAMSPREQILYYYLNLLKRSERSGIPRRKNQTPTEFAPELQQSLPDVEEEVDLLTDAFVHARYSRDSFQQEQASLARTIWQQIRGALRHITRR